MLDRKAQRSFIQKPGDARLQLTTLNSGETRVPHAVIVPVEPTGVEPPVVSQRPVEVQVVASESLRCGSGTHGTAEDFTARLVDEIDNGARGVGAKQW